MNYRTEEMRAHWYIKANTSAFSKMTSVAQDLYHAGRQDKTTSIAMD